MSQSDQRVPFPTRDHGSGKKPDSVIFFTDENRQVILNVHQESRTGWSDLSVRRMSPFDDAK